MTGDARPAAHALLTDEPGVVLHSPRQRLARLLVLYAVLPLICAGAGAFIAYRLSEAAVDARVAALEQDLAQRRATAAAANAERDTRLEQTRRDLCVVVDRVRPRDRAVQDVRRRYGCTGSPSPSAAPSPSGRQAGAQGSGARPSAGAGRVGRPTRTAAPPRTPARPQPAPEPRPTPRDLLDLCVPLLDLCV